MNLEENKKELSWYNNPSLLTSLILLDLFLILIFSQSLGIGSQLTAQELFRNIINLNTSYVLVFIYFLLLNFRVGKRYFNTLNLILILLYFIITITSFLSIFHVFNIFSCLMFGLNFVLFIQMFHVLLRDTRIWDDFGLSKSPFNEIHSDSYFYIISILSILYLAINLVFTSEFDSVVIILFVSIFYMFFSRFLMLYSNYLDSKGIDVENTGSFDKLKEKVSEKINIDVVEDTMEKLSEKIEDLENKVKEYTDNIDIDSVKEADEDLSKKTVKRKKTSKKKDGVK